MRHAIQSVTGPVEPESLGSVLTHEHLLHSLSKVVFKTPLPASLLDIPKEAITIENLAWIKQYPYSFDVNLDFDDEAVIDAVTDEMNFFRRIGGGTVVDNSSLGLRAKNHANYLKKLSEETGVKIVMGTGFYVAHSQTPEVLKYSSEKIQEIMKNDIMKGVDGTTIKCGVIGELGCSWPIYSFEKQVLLSAGAVQEELNCPVIIHPGRNKSAPEEIVRIYLEAGGRANRTVMSHLDRTFTTKEEFAEFASLGTFSELDLFGTEVSHYQLGENVDMPNDIQRISFLRHLIDEGYGHRIVISHDIHTKHRLMKFGGHGYSHILVNVVPKMIKRGIKMQFIRKMLTSNPKDWLTMPISW